MSSPFIYEILYRGRAEDDPAPPAWQVVIGQWMSLPGQAPELRTGQALTPRQAAAAGYSTESIMGEHLHAAVTLAERTRDALEEMRVDRDGRIAEATELRTDIENLRAEMASQAAAFESSKEAVDSMASEVVERATEAVKTLRGEADALRFQVSLLRADLDARAERDALTAAAAGSDGQEATAEQPSSGLGGQT